MSTHSSLPPLPPGVPPRPGSDSYRPLPPPPASDRYPRTRSPEQFDMYTFHGNGYSSRNVTHQRVPRHPRSPSRPNLPVEPSGRQNYAGDSYRPAPNGFTFSMPPPPSINMNRNSDSYRPTSLRSDDNINDAHTGQARIRHRGHRPNRGQNSMRGRGTWSRKAADRPFLLSTRATTPELMPGMEETDGAGVKYKALEDLSDSDEADMELSSDSENDQKDLGTDEHLRKKQARIDLKQSADGDSIPKWSNPDPYTVLPPPDESQRKKMDVVKLIRKARVVGSSESATKTEAVTDDFISFDFNEEENEELYQGRDSADNENKNGILGGARNSHNHRHLDDTQHVLSSAPSGPRSTRLQFDTSSDPALGSRKRNFEDEIKDAPLLPIKRTPSRPAEGSIVQEWQSTAGINTTPWCTVDHAATENMGFWLHKEIMDFYSHVRPTEFEDTVRSDLISGLRETVKYRWKDADIYPFGSFVAGLYLPTADMDLVFASERYVAGGPARYHNKATLFKFRDYIISEEIPVTGSVEVVSKAKVPLVKYVDKRTGLRVDISFENDTGLIANKTFKDWKTQYPAMPILATIVKQFLAMRGLNEPVNGGIGGFSVTCLVISLLQLLPQVQSGNMIPEHHLGELLMEFLDLYGNEFNAVTTAIQLRPPGYLPKTQAARFVYNRETSDLEKLCIVDPNNESNDIAGGSKNTPRILEAFSRAFRDLQNRMAELRSMPIDQRHGQSILGVILGGDYSSFDIQRDHLRKCYESTTKS